MLAPLCKVLQHNIMKGNSLIKRLFCALALLAILPVGAQADLPKPNLSQQLHSLEQLLANVEHYYYEETDPVELYHGAIEGYLSKLDPHSTYIRPEDLVDAQERLQGSFEGIGIFFEIVDDVLTVLSPIEGSPAYRAGLLPGDQVYRIDSKSAIGLKVTEVTDRLKGKKGTRVVVSVKRANESELLDFEIVRDKILVPSVPYSFMLSKDIGYVKVTRFSGRTAEELEVAVSELIDTNAQKLILDLRGNGGGYLEQAVAVANLFVERGRLLVYTQGRRRSSRENHYAKRDPLFPPDQPLIVLVDGSSASASEIVAGAVQDYDRGLVVGHTTFGKGLVQKQYSLKNRGVVLLTIARYFTPSDRPIQRPFSEDRAAYRNAAFDDYDPNVDPDSTSGKPVFYTNILKRKVYGDGGITPDVPLVIDSLNVLSRRLTHETFLAFAKREDPTIGRVYQDFETFFQKYHPSRPGLTAFKAFLKVRNVPFTDDEFDASSEFIQKRIKQFIAQIRWGARAEGRVRVHSDPHVEQAMALFAKAEQLLVKRAGHYNGNRTYDGDRYKQVR